MATNALLEHRVGRVALVATAGFADVIEIARQSRPSLYDLHIDRSPPLVPRDLRFEVRGRLDGSGREIEAFDGRVPDLNGADAVAVCLLHADLDASHERAVAHALEGSGSTSCSHEVSPEFREFERMVTTVADAALRPVCRAYLLGLGSLAREVLVMTSAGGLVPLEDAATPTGLTSAVGSGGRSTGRGSHRQRVRLCRCRVVRHGRHEYRRVPRPRRGARSRADARDRRLSDPPPTVAVHTIGAGGGSIARLDAGGALVVGPQARERSPARRATDGAVDTPP